ncbi:MULTISPECIES: cell division protein FtsQ/DivIB [unclassified Sphingomonas]|uniref:cell division protein FtsQ/DivIB n=1 Tax=unclassified Sphingomonas TaxID=196159 RepID=UPI001D129E9B|nr:MULTISPECIES: cell division protein FtsQ/DivIB [unclassified Sphingomonas]MCC2980251.1 FtsQ-type POTRA domain-containing protein [Sphingomonas sp. IC4-52]MCD2315002.1 FtsQ-type POTRA domain-containing protein [Sphingomonas sp. IC-11]
MSRSITRGGPQRRPTVRRPPPKKSLGDRLITALPVSEAALRRAVTWSILGLGGAVAIATASWFGVPGAIGTAMADTTGQMGLRVEQVDITGIKRMNRETVYAVALEEQPKAMLRVDLELIRQRLLAYGWIADAYVSRRLPDRLLIHIVEREPAAIWQNGGALTLIDAKGVPLEPVDPSRMPDLPLVIGPGADRQEAAYQRLLAAAPALKPRVKAATWVGNRRWDITFDTGETLALPQDNAAGALVKFAELDGARSLLGKGWLRFDMRDPAKLVARKPGTDMEQAVPETGAGAAVESARFARIDEV